MKIKACLTHKTDIWETPINIYNYYKERNYFDPCPINPKEDGLKIEWKEKNFVNPPYSQLKKWVKKAIEEKIKGNITIMLIPARTDTQAFKMLLNDIGTTIYLIEGRLKFSNKNPAPFPSMIVEIKPHTYILWNKIQYLSKKDMLERYGK